jgi:hypothetical protein
MTTPQITFVSAWYKMKSKFPPETYHKWIENMLSNVLHYNLVVFTDESSSSFLMTFVQSNPEKIKIVIKPFQDFYCWRYRNFWQENHTRNVLLNQRTCWELNMLWSEKVHFVYETMHKGHFPPTEYYGWCDIGYFRDGCSPLFACQAGLFRLNPEKIHYACVNYDSNYLNYLRGIVQDKTDIGLPSLPIPANQVSIAGGFFVCHADRLEWWKNTYLHKLELYIDNDYLVKDDQIIIADCVFSCLSDFVLVIENAPQQRDPWFVFREFLSGSS